MGAKIEFLHAPWLRQLARTETEHGRRNTIKVCTSLYYQVHQGYIEVESLIDVFQVKPTP